MIILKMGRVFFPILLLSVLCSTTVAADPQAAPAEGEKSATKDTAANETPEEAAKAPEVEKTPIDHDAASIEQFRDLVSRAKLVILEAEEIQKEQDRSPKQLEALDLLNKADIIFKATAPNVRELQMLTEAGNWVADQLAHLRALPQVVELADQCRARGFLHYRNEEYDKALMAFDEYRIFVPNDKAVEYLIAQLYKTITDTEGS